MKKKVLIWLLAAVLVLSMAGCAAGAASSTDKYADMEPAAAAEAAAAETKDTTGISDIIRVPFGYLLDWLYTFTNNYGLALILFSLIVKLVLLPMSVKSKKSMLKMSRLSPQVKALEAKYGDDKQKYQQEVNQLYVVFSPNAFYKKVDCEIDKGLPRMLSAEAFQEWLSACRMKDPQMNVSRKILTVTKK